MTSVNTTNNITSLTIYGLVKGNNYSFTVKGIDHAGQIGSSSQLVYFIFDGKQICPDLQKEDYFCYKDMLKKVVVYMICYIIYIYIYIYIYNVANHTTTFFDI